MTACAIVDRLASILVDDPARSTEEVFRRCQAADALAEIGPDALSAVPVLLRTLVVPVSVDCGLALRVAAAAAVWKVSGRSDVVLPILAWALKDDHWGVSPRAAEVLAEIGHAAVVPDLIRIAARRLDHGPFFFESYEQITVGAKSRSFLVILAEALGSCGRGRCDEGSYALEARAMLLRMVNHEDNEVRDAALQATAGLEGVA
jgi:HEAT repeat protein